MTLQEFMLADTICTDNNFYILMILFYDQFNFKYMCTGTYTLAMEESARASDVSEYDEYENPLQICHWIQDLETEKNFSF